MKIITHRGLDPAQPHAESSFEAFNNHLSRGFGLEFDLRFTKDNVPIISHDADLSRLSKGLDERLIDQIKSEEIFEMKFNNHSLASLAVLLNLIERRQEVDMISAMHIKHTVQNTLHLDSMLDYFKNVNLNDFFLFDLKIETARYLKSKNPKLLLAPSVAHPYDIRRYGQLVGNTLLSVDEVIANKDLFDWVWLDEWDTFNEGGHTKTFYNAETFELLRSYGFKIALVTPELHGALPNVPYARAHSDSYSYKKLMNRIEKIIHLSPDAICTDFPDEVRVMCS